jgi:hypothetical protein
MTADYTPGTYALEFERAADNSTFVECWNMTLNEAQKRAERAYYQFSGANHYVRVSVLDHTGARVSDFEF